MTITEYPENDADKIAAAFDPLTSVDVLRRLYAENVYDLNSALARNSSLPIDILAELLKKKDSDSSWLLLHSSTTFEQIRYLVKMVAYEDRKAVQACETVVELFDLLIQIEGYPSDFLSMLLCSPLVGREDFIIRAEFYEDFLVHWIIFADERFDVNSMDITLVEGLIDLEAISKNVNASCGLLGEIINLMSHLDYPFDAPYYNQNCPVNLAASHFAKTIDSQKWSPSRLVGFEPKFDAYLAEVHGDGPWAELPLAWKLKMVVE